MKFLVKVETVFGIPLEYKATLVAFPEIKAFGKSKDEAVTNVTKLVENSQLELREIEVNK